MEGQRVKRNAGVLRLIIQAYLSFPPKHRSQSKAQRWSWSTVKNGLPWCCRSSCMESAASFHVNRTRYSDWRKTSTLNQFLSQWVEELSFSEKVLLWQLLLLLSDISSNSVREEDKPRLLLRRQQQEEGQMRLSGTRTQRRNPGDGGDLFTPWSCTLCTTYTRRCLHKDLKCNKKTTTIFWGTSCC